MNRVGFLGGTDVAALVPGCCPSWTSPWKVWAETVGLITGHETNERLEIGKDAEVFLARVFERRTSLVVAGEQMELANPAWPWLRGHCDGLVFDACAAEPSVDLAIGGIEFKTDQDWTAWDEVPAHYEVQARVYMALTGLDRWWVVAGFSGWRVEIYEITRDAEIEKMILGCAEAFWGDHVVPQIPPPVDGRKPTSTAVRDAWPEHTPDAEVDLTSHAETIAAWIAAVEERKAAEAREDALENEIRVLMAGAEFGVVDGVPALTLRSSSRTTIDTTALTEAHPDIAAAFSRTKPSKPTLRVAPKPKTRKKGA
jgi:predicted phage-related endonuclease